MQLKEDGSEVIRVTMTFDDYEPFFGFVSYFGSTFRPLSPHMLILQASNRVDHSLVFTRQKASIFFEIASCFLSTESKVLGLDSD